MFWAVIQITIAFVGFASITYFFVSTTTKEDPIVLDEWALVLFWFALMFLIVIVLNAMVFYGIKKHRPKLVLPALFFIVREWNEQS